MKLMPKTTKTISTTIQVQRLFAAIFRGEPRTEEWRDDGHLQVDLVFDSTNPDAMTCLGADVAVALCDYLLRSAASRGFYRLGEHVNAPVYEYTKRGSIELRTDFADAGSRDRFLSPCGGCHHDHHVTVPCGGVLKDYSGPERSSSLRDSPPVASNSPTWKMGQQIRRLDTDAVGSFESTVFPEVRDGSYKVLGWWYGVGKAKGPMTLEEVPLDRVEEADKNCCAGHCGAVGCVRGFGHKGRKDA
jgi:hypothetical protein